MREPLALMAAYHRWAFGVMYAALPALSEADYRRDCGLFFRSVHGTLNHLLLADRVWYGRCTGAPYAVTSLAQELEPARPLLEQALLAQSARWQPWLAGCAETALAAELHYTNLTGTEFRTPLAPALMHVFNHATHHRGQISAALSAYGLAVPEMDLIVYLRRA